MAGYIIFTIVYFTALGMCVFFAWKRPWVNSLMSAVAAAVSFGEAYLLTRLFISEFGGTLSDALKEAFLELLNMESAYTIRDTATLKTASFAVTILLGLAAFLVLFLILWIINSFIKKMLAAMLFKNGRSDADPTVLRRLLSVAGGLVSFGVVSFALMYPLGAVSNIVNSAADICGYEPKASIITNPVSKLYGVAGRDYFDALTKIDSAEDLVNSDEAQYGAEVVISVMQISQGEAEDSAVRIAKSLRSSYILTDLISEVVANASNTWMNGREFLYMEPEMPKGREGELINGIFEMLSQWRRENLVQDIDTSIYVYDLLRRYDIMAAGDGEELLEALSQEEFVEELFLELSRNEDFIEMIPQVMRFGLSSSADALKIEMKNEYIVEFDARGLSEDEWRKEAEAFSTLLRRMSILSRGGQKIDIEGLLNDLYALRESKLLSNILLNLLIQLAYNVQQGIEMG